MLSEKSPLLLGSASPRRREILANVGVPIVVRPADVDEATREGESPDAYLERVVAAKLEAVRGAAAGVEAAAILVADTSVIEGGVILGKPASIDEAAHMIARLAGKTHEVHTRFAIGVLDAGDALHAETVVTRVTFRPLGAAHVRAYAESGEGMDKAGAYAVQGRGAALVSRIEGSYSNVVGLPACEVVVALERLGLLA